MGIFRNGARRAFKTCAVGVIIGAATIVFAAAPSKGHAQTHVTYKNDPLIVRNDRGGLLRERLRQISTLRQQSRPVEIRGSVCFSTCTMLIGLPNACVSPNTTFGFHGPSSYGRALDPATFNYASEVIASYYPAPLQSWYMNTARFKITSISRIKGAELIRMGVPSC